MTTGPNNEPNPAGPQGDAPDLAELIDIPAIQALMDAFHALESIGMAIVDLHGNVLVAAGWQDICTQFHRVHPETLRHCIESDTALTTDIAPGEFKLYHCRNHLWDMATPIAVGGRHVGNFFLGQFFFDDEKVDVEIFRAQARQYGFDEAAYLAALDRVPRWSRDKVNRAMTYYARFSGLISELGWRNFQLRQTLDEQRQTKAELDKSEARHRAFIDASADLVFLKDDAFRYLISNAANSAFLGHPEEEVLGRTDYDLMPAETAEHCRRSDRDALRAGRSVSSEETVENRTYQAVKFPVPLAGNATGVGGIIRDITESKRVEERLENINTCLLGLGPDTSENIRRITALCGEMLGATCALYNRLDGGLLCSIGQWNTPPEYDPKDRPEGHICYDVIQRAESRPVVIRNLPATFYAETDPNVARYGLQTYWGHAIRCGDRMAGSLCVVFQRDAEPTESDLRVLGILAASISREEERQQTVEHLRLHAQLLDSVTESVVASDLDGRILYWGRGAERLYGYSADEVMGRPYREFAGPVDPPDEEAFRRDLMAHGSWIGVHRQKNRRGGVFWTSTAISLVRDSQGQPAGFIGIDLDITDRQQAEERLRLSDERFNQVAATAKEWIWEMGADGVFTYSNPVVEHILGYKPEEIVGRMSFLDLIAPEAREDIRQAAAERVARKEGFHKKVNPVLCKDGRVVILETSGVPILDAEGRLVGYRGTDTDITERTRAEEALRDSEARYRSVLNASPDIITIADLEGRILMVSSSALTMLGYKREDQMVGRPVFDFIVPEDRERAAADMARMLRDPTPTTDEYRALRADGSTLDVEVNSETIRDDSDQPRQMLLAVRNVSERKRAEDKLRASIEQVQDIAANIPGVIYQLRITRTGGLEIPYMSAGCEALLEWPLADVDYTGLLFGHMHVGDRALFQHSVAAAARAQERWTLEFRILRPDGRPKWLRGSANPRTLPDGTSVWSGVLLDIDDLKQAEEARRESEAFHHRLMNAIPIPVFYKDRKGCYRVFNKAFEMFYNKRTEELAGHSVFDVFPRDLATRYHAKDLELLEHPGTQTYESQLENGQGILRHVVFHKASITDSRGAVIGIIGTIHDITERKESEKKMADQLEELRRWQAVTLGREERIAGLKREVNAHAARLGQPAPYASVEASP